MNSNKLTSETSDEFNAHTEYHTGISKGHELL